MYDFEVVFTQRVVITVCILHFYTRKLLREFQPELELESVVFDVFELRPELGLIWLKKSLSDLRLDLELGVMYEKDEVNFKRFISSNHSHSHALTRNTLVINNDSRCQSYYFLKTI